jgi:UDP-2-acetamido-3-amino-2,3-dideoxy-glucuronate N-acetyltransferase
VGWFKHDSAIVDDGALIGDGTKIWHFCHVSSGARIGADCMLGQNVYVAGVVGDRVRLQNNVSVFDGVVLDDDVFVGPSAVFTNVINPRSEFSRKSEYMPTRVGAGATIGANATIVCGITVGRYAFVGAGAVVTHDVKPFALVVGVPARQIGWICRCGVGLHVEHGRCAECGRTYRYDGDELLET